MESFIAEYNNMYGKLNTIAGYHNNLFLFTLTSSGAILTYAIQQNNPYIAFVNMVILILLRCRVMSYRNEYYQILVYIREILEPRIGLDSKVLISLDNTRIANIQYFIYSILGFGTVLECVFIEKDNIVVLMASIIFYIIIVILDIYYYFYSKKLYKNYENRLH